MWCVCCSAREIKEELEERLEEDEAGGSDAGPGPNIRSSGSKARVQRGGGNTNAASAQISHTIGALPAPAAPAHYVDPSGEGYASWTGGIKGGVSGLPGVGLQANGFIIVGPGLGAGTGTGVGGGTAQRQERLAELRAKFDRERLAELRSKFGWGVAEGGGGSNGSSSGFGGYSGSEGRERGGREGRAARGTPSASREAREADRAERLERVRMARASAPDGDTGDWIRCGGMDGMARPWCTWCI